MAFDDLKKKLDPYTASLLSTGDTLAQGVQGGLRDIESGPSIQQAPMEGITQDSIPENIALLAGGPAAKLGRMMARDAGTILGNEVGAIGNGIMKPGTEEELPYLYHISPKKNRASIMERGIEPRLGERTLMGHSANDPGNVASYYSDEPILGKDPKLNSKYNVFRINPEDADVYHYDGYGATNVNSGKYFENEDLNDILPKGVEPGDYFTTDTVKPEDVTDQFIKLKKKVSKKK